MLPQSAPSTAPRYLLWIDGVGTFLICLRERVSLGSPASKDEADIALFAPLRHEHIAVSRCKEGYLLEPGGATRVNGREVHGVTDLQDNTEILLAGSVKLRFRLPSALSRSARIEVLSNHRASRAINGIILMDDTCLLGPGPENHIRCRDWEQAFVLFRRGGELHCRSRGTLLLNGQRTGGEVGVESGSIVQGLDSRFRMEAI